MVGHFCSQPMAHCDHSDSKLVSLRSAEAKFSIALCKGAHLKSLFLAGAALLTAGCSNLSPNSIGEEPDEREHAKAWFHEIEFQSCMDAVDLGAFKNTQWLDCHEAALDRFDSLLNTNYAALQRKLDSSDDLHRLRDSQRRWIEYRDSYCEFTGQLDVAPTPEINHTSCMVELTAEQAQRLSEAY